MLRAGCLFLFAVVFLLNAPGVRAQNPPPVKPQSKASAEAIAKSDAEAENELQNALANAGNDRAALVRNLKDYLARFPDSPRRAAVYRALVESCQQLRDNACALDFAERLIAIQPDDSEMMLLAVNLLRQQGDSASLTRAYGYISRVLDRIEKSKPDERPARSSLADWQEHRDNLRAALYFLRGQIEDSQHKYQAATKDLKLSFEIRPNAAAAKTLGEIAEMRRDLPVAIEEYTFAFVLPETGPGGKVDRREVRWKLGNLWIQSRGSEKGLGEEILSVYDRLTAPPANPGPAARNKKAKDVFGFVVRNLDGSPFPLEPLRGKIVVLSFWATWCGPCRELEPALSQMARDYTGNSAIAFFAVDTDEDETLVAPYLAHEKWGLPIVFADGLDDFLSVTSLPTVLIVDRSGKISYRVNGYSPDGFSESVISAIQAALVPSN
ncbi:MAG: thioredoxin domain-containing protein [Candidatus Acidiferrales bacterium]